ncbi:MAG TPA: hypothetical protein VN947_19510 [Polyangia bacterium]|nr:hypothetical protein [Polyangia bacterium]
MARARKPGDDALPPTRGPTDTPLYALLTARRFRLGASTERVARNLALHGGAVAGDAAAWIGAARPPEDAPSVGLGSFAGTLGPRSFGFVNVHGQVAAFDAPLPSLPRAGGLGLVVPARDALPDVAPLALARGLGLSWIVSVGDGDPAETLAFLTADLMTSALGVVLGPGATGASLRSVLGAKPTVVWGGDALARAVARRAGAVVVDGGLGSFLAHVQLYDAGVEPGAAVEVIVVGGGRAYVDDEVRAAALEARVVAVDERAPEELDAAIAVAAAAQKPVVLVAGTMPSELARAVQSGGAQLLSADLRHPEHLRALLVALAAPVAESESGRTRPRIDKELAARVRYESDGVLSDHDAKRILKAYGARVTRQAPTNTPTGAVKLAKQIGVPCLVAIPGDERVADSMADVKRIAALMLGEAPSIMVRERFPEVPRVRIKVAPEKGLGATMRVGSACALVPLTRADGLALAAATPARRAADQRAVAELLGKISACAADEDVTFDLELFVGAEPCVLAAAGEIRRR